ncbi:hypothetical protein RFN29_08220 [Mesorhizobium sp. VK22B]|uniref:Phospholipase D-like domain-containing protein n=1 Tax=Mesorhizobium captivum TaxID=3072319 RepID=A0ABU4YX70_9HYPH|nr:MULTISPECIES: hypothetical protein [unclassified Mesorhizobium]MDX8491563.1 hypothetical protein [Mesorhizobium sp. VK22B]MDX8505194.1 hypothetical protein [Mesorhizobium sp. VK22E]
MIDLWTNRPIPSVADPRFLPSIPIFNGVSGNELGKGSRTFVLVVKPFHTSRQFTKLQVGNTIRWSENFSHNALRMLKLVAREVSTPENRKVRGLPKLIIQIPCYSEAETLATTLSDPPRTGSVDATIKVAQEHGVDHIPLLTGQFSVAARIWLSARPISEIEHFSPLKKLLQKLGSWVVRVTSSNDVRDAPSGFRAISKDAAQRLIVFNSYTYTLETIIQAGRKNMRVVCFEEHQSLATIKDARRFRSTGFRADGMAAEFIRTPGLPNLMTTQHLRLHA